MWNLIIKNFKITIITVFIYFQNYSNLIKINQIGPNWFFNFRYKKNKNQLHLSQLN